MKSTLIVLLTCTLLADEGMWMPQQLPELKTTLKEMGLTLPPESLTQLTEYPMGAVISLGGCTASFVSDQGLAVTNHHCAYGSIQYNSSPEHNYLRDGFYAATLQDEVPASPGTRIYVTEEVVNVTDQFEQVTQGKSGKDRYDAIERLTKEMIAAGEKKPGYRCEVASFFGGQSFYFISKLEIRDVRLVYAPAEGIGQFGGDIDNWMWPRHTGDFSFYRAYVGPDGQPADLSSDNVPYRPKHVLKIAKEGLREGDFAMVAGYPGRTNRHKLAMEVAHQFEKMYPLRIELFTELLQTIESATAEKEEAAIKYASLVAGINNALKNNQGMVEGFAKSDFLEEKQKEEKAFTDWMKGKNPQAVQAYDQLLALLEKEQHHQESDFISGMTQRISLLGTAKTLYRLAVEKEKSDAERETAFQERNWKRIEQGMQQLDRRLDPKVDQALFKGFILRYATLNPEGQSAAFNQAFGIGAPDFPASLDASLDRFYGNTTLADLTKRLEWLKASRQEFEQSPDPFIQLAVALFPEDQLKEKEEKTNAGLAQEYRGAVMEAFLTFKKAKGEAVYPDANSTLRVTFGTVKGYSPKDGITYQPFTTVKGIFEKHTGEEPFNAPATLMQAAKAGKGKAYLHPDLNCVPVNYLTTVDTTGGNSGSPTLNGEGALVGLLFDGNYESMTSDWLFNPVLTRSIHVDIRFIHFVMAEVDHTTRLLTEMGLN